MKSDYRFRDLDAVDPSNHSRVSDVVPSPENVSQVTPSAAQRYDVLIVTGRFKIIDNQIKEQIATADDEDSALLIVAALNAAEKESNK